MIERLRSRRTRPASEPTAPRPDVEKPTELERVVTWLDERTGFGSYARSALRKVFPDHWSFLLGELALFCFVILVLTGTFLTFFYVPSQAPTVYEGSYRPLAGESVSGAYDSVLRLSFDVRAGLLMRQVHHWTALIFLGAIVIHLSRVFFTGAFRRPREINWLIGFGLLTFAIGEGFTGYSLPDDLLSGTGLRIAFSVLLSIPFAGPNLAFLAFGGPFPGPAVLSRLYVLHIMLLPALLVAGVTVHILIIYIQKHTQYRRPGATESNVIGQRFWPNQALRSTGLFLLTAAVATLIGGLVQVNPVWLYGPFIASEASSPAQPDWYLGFLEGALRLGPNFEPTILGVTIPTVFVPGIVIPGILFVAIALWPFLEAWRTKDHAEHHLLDMPWDAPRRSATGVAMLAILAMLTIAGANDVLATTFDVRVEDLTNALRVLTVAVPIAAWIVTYRLLVERAGRADRPASAERTVVLRRTAAGGFDEVEDR
jgi:ubiquinol-cytochrome c reductase cytochrome b subunit